MWRTGSRAREKGSSPQHLGCLSPVNGGAQVLKEDFPRSLWALPPLGKAALSPPPLPLSVLPAPHSPSETLVLQEVPGKGAGRIPQVCSLWALEKFTLTPIKAASLQGRAEGNLSAQGESKRARKAGQRAFASWGSQHLSPGFLLTTS